MEDGRSIREKLEGRELRIFCNYSMRCFYSRRESSIWKRRAGGVLAAARGAVDHSGLKRRADHGLF